MSVPKLQFCCNCDCTASTFMGTGATVREATISTAKPLGFSIKKGQLETIENFVVDEFYFQSCLLDLCYQCLPGIYNKLCFSSHCSIIIVISPLIAIMKDQVSVNSYY